MRLGSTIRGNITRLKMQNSIQNNTLKITVDSKGAELVSVKHNGVERIWQNQTGGWSGHAPILFPVCGHFGFIYKGKDYAMPAHGFARKSEFTLIEKGDDFLTFSLKSNEKTKEVYPFDFELVVSYKIVNSTIYITNKIKNLSQETMLYALGAHESYMLDMPLETYKLVFPKEEHLVHYDHDDDGYLTGTTVDYGTSNEFEFTEDHLLHDETIIFKGLKSSSVKFCKKTGEEVFDVSFEGFSNLLFWRPEGSQMVCIEPWHNLPDAHGNTQEFAEKDGVQSIPVNGESVFKRTIEYK